MYPSSVLASFTTALLLSGTLALQGGLKTTKRGTAGSGAPSLGTVDKLNKFSIKQVKNEWFKGKSGLEAMLQAYAKYDAPLTPELKDAVQTNLKTSLRKKAFSGTTSAIPPGSYDYEFVCLVQIGTPPQTMYLDFDTGSSDLWVFSNDTESDEVFGQGLYNASNSSTAMLKPGYTFSITYGDGSGARGIVYTDRVAIGNAFYNNMTVESATQVSSQFSNDPYNWGLLGLGMSAGNTVKPNKQLTFMDEIRPSLAAPLFAANLKHGTPGEYDFGYISPSEYTGNIQYAYIDKASIYWKFVATGYRVGPATSSTNPNSGYQTLPWRAIADTGTTLLLLPDSIVSAYYSGVNGAAYDNTWAAILFPCSDTLPDFTFGIGNYLGIIPGRYINYGNVNSTYCYGGIQSQGTLGFGIFGDIALKAQYVVFDLGNMRIGFANKALST